METPKVPVREITTPSGYVLQLRDHVTLADEESVMVSVAKKALPAEAGEGVSAEDALANQMANFYLEQDAWLGLVVLSVKTPTGELAEGAEAVRNLVRNVLPRAEGSEIQDEVREIVRPKKLKPTGNTTAPATAGEQKEAS